MKNRNTIQESTASRSEWRQLFKHLSPKRREGDVCIGLEKQGKATNVYWTANDSKNFCRIAEKKYPKAGYLPRTEVRTFMEKHAPRLQKASSLQTSTQERVVELREGSGNIRLNQEWREIPMKTRR